MGCGGSRDSAGNSPASANHVIYDRKPKISVRIGDEVQRHNGSPTVIFIFGGPGSRKGRIVDDLINSYECKFICSEQLIMTELPRKVSKVMKIENIKDIKDLLEEDPSHVSMEWILQNVEQYIERDNDEHATYIVDYLPNLKYLLRIPDITKDCKSAMNKFEERNPVSFALNLAVPPDKVLKAKQTYCAPPKSGGEGLKETGGQGDEANSERTQRRAELYQQSVNSFLDYFAKTERLVTVDVTSGVADLIWNQVHQTMCELEFHPSRAVNTVVLFVFDDNYTNNIDIDKLYMKQILLRSLVSDPFGSVETLMSALCTYLDNQSENDDAFVVSLADTSVTEQNTKKLEKKPITFLEVEEGYLENYLPGSPKGFQPRNGTPRYKAIGSLENEVCLFPGDTSNEMCLSIAGYMAVKRYIK